MFKELTRLFRKKKEKKVVIGSKVLKIAEPIAHRYYTLTELLTIPEFEAIAKIQSELEQALTELHKKVNEQEQEELRKKIAELQERYKTQLTSHVSGISEMFKKKDYESLVEVLKCVCEGEITKEDVMKCYEIEVKVAVDFFLAKHYKILRDTTQSYASFATEQMS